MQVTPDNQYLLMPENYNCGGPPDPQLVNQGGDDVERRGRLPHDGSVPPVPLWYEATATHTPWSSLPSTPTMYSVGRIREGGNDRRRVPGRCRVIFAALSHQAQVATGRYNTNEVVT